MAVVGGCTSGFQRAFLLTDGGPVCNMNMVTNLVVLMNMAVITNAAVRGER